MVVPIPVIVAALVAFFAGRRSVDEKSPPAMQSRARPLEQPKRPRTLAVALSQEHPRLEYAVRASLIGDTSVETPQRFQAAPLRLLEARLATRSFHLCDLQAEPDAQLWRLGPLGRHSALDAIREGLRLGGHVYLTLAAAFELVADMPPSAAAIVAIARPDRPTPSLARMRQFALLSAGAAPASAVVVRNTTSAPPATPSSSSNGAHKPVDAPTPATSSTGAPPEA